MKEMISSRQAAILASILIFANKILTLPSLLFKYGKGDSIFILAFMLMVDLLVLVLFFRLKRRFKNASFFAILSSHLSKTVAVIIYVLLIVYFLAKLLLNFNATHIYFKMQVYHNDQESIFVFALLVILAIFISGGFRSLCRTIEFFYIPIIFGLLFCLLISFANFKHSLMVFDTSVFEFFKGAYKFSFAFGDFLVLFLFMDKIELSDDSRKKFFIYLFISILIELVEYFLFFSIFQYTAFMHTNAISDIIVLSYEIIDIGRLDFIAVVTIMLLTFCQMGIWGYAISVLLLTIFPKMPKKYSILVISVIFLLLYVLFFNSFDRIIQLVSVGFPIAAILIQYFLPFITIVFKKRGKE